jgi:hypothetical protein
MTGPLTFPELNRLEATKGVAVLYMPRQLPVDYRPVELNRLTAACLSGEAVDVLSARVIPYMMQCTFS